MVTFPVLPLTGFVFLGLFGLLECLVVWLISVPVVKVWLPGFSSGAIGIINFERLSPSFVVDTMGWFLNSVLGWGRFCIGACRGLSGPEFYGDLVCELKKIVGGAGFSDRFGRIIVRYKRIGCGTEAWGRGWVPVGPVWAPQYFFILTVPRRYFYCGSLLFLLSVFILWFSYYVSDIFCKF